VTREEKKLFLSFCCCWKVLARRRDVSKNFSIFPLLLESWNSPFTRAQQKRPLVSPQSNGRAFTFNYNTCIMNPLNVKVRKSWHYLQSENSENRVTVTERV
jgi:hypothetical protein